MRSRLLMCSDCGFTKLAAVSCLAAPPPSLFFFFKLLLFSFFKLLWLCSHVITSAPVDALTWKVALVAELLV